MAFGQGLQNPQYGQYAANQRGYASGMPALKHGQQGGYDLEHQRRANEIGQQGFYTDMYGNRIDVFGNVFNPNEGSPYQSRWQDQGRQADPMGAMQMQQQQEDDALRRQRQGEMYDKIMGMFGGGGLGGATGNVRDVSTPGQWTPDQAAVPASSIDPMDVIKAQQPLLQREMERMMAEASVRSGARGGLQGTGYTNALNRAALEGSQNLNALTMQTLGQHAENQAQREAQAQQAALDRSLNAWNSYGSMGQNAGIANQNADLRQIEMQRQLIPALMGFFGGF